MRELAKKAGSLALAAGALALVLANAAVTHGCSAARPPGAPSSASSPPSSVDVAAAKPDPDCVVPSYMYATKAPIFVPPKCRGEAASEPAAQASPGPENAAQHQAP